MIKKNNFFITDNITRKENAMPIQFEKSNNAMQMRLGNIQIQLDNINEHSEIEAFLNSESPDIKAPKDKDKKYLITITDFEKNFTEKVKVTPLEIACFSGKLPLVKSLQLDDEIKKQIQNPSTDNHLLAIYFVTSLGHSDILDHFMSLLSDKEQHEFVKLNKYALIQNAAVRGHTSMVQSLEKHLTPEELHEFVMDDFMYLEISAHGNAETMAHLLSHFDPNEKRNFVSRIHTRQSNSNCLLDVAKMYENTSIIQFYSTLDAGNASDASDASRQGFFSPSDQSTDHANEQLKNGEQVSPPDVTPRNYK